MKSYRTTSQFCSALTLMALSAAMASAQFSSGSTGSDGALNFTTPGTIIFDPVALGLDPAGDNIFNFTTINIGTGVTVVLTAGKLRERSVVWLATGAVTIAGTLTLSGANGYPAGSTANLRAPSQPGPGGYAGGVGATDSSPAEPGAGPGGGVLCCGAGVGGSYATAGGDYGGPVYGNSLLVPLRGGSGGSGSTVTNGAGAGAGGGAIQIVSSTSISVTGSLLSNGGNGDPNSGQGGSGSGGAIHLEAPNIAGNGTIQAVGGQTLGVSLGYNSNGGNGWIRIDSTTNTFTGTVTPTPTLGPLFNSPLPSAVPIVTIVSINGVAVPAVPTGSFTMPDVTINSGVAVPVSLAATNIPLGTVLTLSISSETGADQVVSSSALAGTVASSTATASILWPLGVSRIYVRASW